MTPVNIAIVGVGRMGTFHARQLSDLDHAVDVVAVADSQPDRASAVGSEIGATAYTSIEALLDDDRVEAWLIASSTPSHPQLVTAAIGHGLHVLCEKPLALDGADSVRLGELAGAAGVVLQVGFWRRFSPPWAAAKRLLGAGAIGRPLMLRLSQWDADAPPAAFCDPAVSGGLAVDCGVHEFDLTEWLTEKEVCSVTARELPLADPALADVGDVDNLVAVLDLTDGSAATVDLSRNCRYGDDVRTEILGEEGAIFVDLLPSGRTRLATSRGIEIVPDSETSDATAAGVAGQAVAFSQSVRGAEVGVPGARASTRALLVARAVQLAAQSGQTIHLQGA